MTPLAIQPAADPIERIEAPRTVHELRALLEGLDGDLPVYDEFSDAPVVLITDTYVGIG